jgi:signal transduction histidine kinase
MAGFANELWITVGANAVSGAIIFIGGLFVLFQNPRRDINWLFFFITVTTLLYTVFFIIASLQTAHDAAYFWWFLNIFDTIIPMAVVHFIFRVIKRDREWRWFIIATYLIGAVVFIVPWFHPTWFLPDVVPKLYFPFYLTAGWWYIVMLVYFFGALFVAVANLVNAYRLSAGIERQRLEYFILMIAVGYSIGCLNFLLVFNIPFDPVFGSFVGFYLIPVAYGVFATDLLDIRLVVRRAFYYAFSIAAIAAFLVALILFNGFLERTIPGFQFWTVPVIVAIVAFIIGRSVLKQARESEKLKYEFITVATHKLRTPLTRIRWVIPELLAQAGTNHDLREGIRRIDDANNQLIELTNVLMEAAHPGGTYDYQQIPVDLRHLAWEAVKRFATQIAEKKLAVSVDAENPPLALGDARRLALVAEVLVENAVMYTPAGGKVHITVAPDRHGVRFAVTDTGIGVNREDQENIFSSFYRTNAARTADTEGVGLGLSLSKNIVDRQGGRIGIVSEGEGKGSTFWFTMPLAA